MRYAAIIATIILAACDPCATSAPIVDRGDGLVDEAHERVVEARAVAAFADSPTALAHVMQAEQALTTAEIILRIARKQCSSVDLKEIFGPFSDAWDAVRPFVGGVGGTEGYVPDPEAYRVGR